MNPRFQLQDITTGRNENPLIIRKRQVRIKEAIVKRHEESYQIYGAPKITKVLQTNGHRIAQRIVSKYMNEEGIKAHTIKPYTTTTRDSDFQPS